MSKTKLVFVVSVVLLVFMMACDSSFEKSISVKIKNLSGDEISASYGNDNNLVNSVFSDGKNYDFKLYEESFIKIESLSLGKPYPYTLTVKEKGKFGSKISEIEIILEEDDIVTHILTK